MLIPLIDHDDEVNVNNNVSFTSDWVRVGDPYFWGRSKRSPDGEWLVAWGIVKKGSGMLLMKDESVCVWKTRAMANGGDVANNGSSILYDLGGNVTIRDAQGEILFKKKLRGSILSGSISPGGKYAASHALAPSKKSGGSVLTMVDLATGSIVRQVPNPVWPVLMDFNDEEGWVQLTAGNGDRALYVFQERKTDSPPAPTESASSVVTASDQ
jgi:hypothetical protein